MMARHARTRMSVHARWWGCSWPEGARSRPGSLPGRDLSR